MMAEPVSKFPENDAPFTDLPVGEILRRTRIHYQQTLEDIERALRIRASQIEAIETSNLEQLPGRVYAIGFVRSYSEYLGLDGDKMVALYKKQVMAVKGPEPELYFPAPASDTRLPPWWVILTSIFLVIALLSFWFGQNNKGREIVENIPPVPPEMQIAIEETPASAVAETSPPAPMAEELEAPQEEEVIIDKPAEGIILNIRENSWVEIRDKKGKAMLSRVLKAGDQYYVPDRPDLTISIGNAGGVEIEVDGQALRKLGETGQVVRRLPLDVEYLKNNFAVETP